MLRSQEELPRRRRRCPRSVTTSSSVASLDGVVTPDVNVLVYSHRVESPDHERYAAWVKQLALGPEPFGLSDHVSASFVRIVTNRRLWNPPTSPTDALEFV